MCESILKYRYRSDTRALCCKMDSQITFDTENMNSISFAYLCVTSFFLYGTFSVYRLLKYFSTLATFSYSNTHSCTGDRSYRLRCHLLIRIGIQKHMESHASGYALGGNVGFCRFPRDTLTHWLQGLGIKLDHCSICLRVFQDVTYSWTRDHEENRGHAFRSC